MTKMTRFEGGNVRRFSRLAAALLPLAVIGLGVSTSTAAPGANGTERVRVIVAYKDGQRSNASRALAMAGAEVHYDFAALGGYAVSLPAVAVEGLSRNPAIAYVEEDAKRYPMAQTVPYGIAMVQANQLSDSAASNTMVCIIDSGIDGNHEDHLKSKMNGEYDSGTGNWYTDENHHGTHVAGTVAALNNSLGVVGVLPSGQLNLYIVKVFGADGWAYSSNLITALNKCVAAKGTKNLVVSMSLGGSVKSKFEDTAFKNAYTKNNALSIAAAGNDGNNRISYPAGYASVVSVAAIDETKARASFSQYNSDVELAAPGVAVLSTVPTGTGTGASVTVGGTGYAADGLDGSPLGSVTSNSGMVDCGLAGSVCTDATGKVCLIQRGTYNFSDKVLNCKNGGGIGAIIYNNTTGPLLGTLNGVVTGIPSVGITQKDGVTLKGQLSSSTTVAVVATHYARFDGTSMATPHVSGVAALVWSNYPKCSNAQIRTALTATAEDLGTAGRDTSFGYGLVRAKSAADSLGTICP
jgi:subtilisin family serine protease